MGNFGVGLSPTILPDISEMNVFDAVIKWYGYDEKRERVFIFIDKLWKDKKRKTYGKTHDLRVDLNRL